MDIQTAGQLAVSLMDKHHLLTKGWEFKFDNAKRRCGACSYTRKQIRLSRSYAQLNEVAEVTDTILHEIAHALCPTDAHHGHFWKLQAIAVGARPETCAASNVVSVPGKYFGICKDCGQRFERYKRMRANTVISSFHTDCRKAGRANRGRIEWHHRNGQPMVRTLAGFTAGGNVAAVRAAVAAQVSQQPKSDLTQSDVSAMWERLNRLEGKI